MKITNIAILLFSISLFSCQQREIEKEPIWPPTDTLKTGYHLIADTISYGVVVKNRDTSDVWKEKWLSQFERDSLVNRIFSAVYNKELRAYDYFSGEHLSVRDVRKLEKNEEFDRSLVGKIQFEEIWFFDPEELQMVKTVHSIMLAYEAYRADNTFKGYKPAFKVYLHKPFKRK